MTKVGSGRPNPEGKARPAGDKSCGPELYLSRVTDATASLVAIRTGPG